MSRIIALVLLGACSAFAQTTISVARVGTFQTMSSAAVQGAPYTATITNESIQTLADGNRIVQTSSGMTARDSMGRTRQDAPLMRIGNMTPEKEPHLVFVQDPVAQTSFTLNLADKTAMKAPAPMQVGTAGVMVGTGGGVAMAAHVKSAIGPLPNVQVGGPTFNVGFAGEGTFKPQTEELGSQTMEGVLVTGTRTTMTIPAGEIGNDKALNIVTEVWTSPELKTVVLSKRSDPRMGDQTFKLTNIVRAEPDPALFTVPSDFKIVDEPQPVLYKPSGIPGQ
jgi:hypothetical protein